MDLYNAGIQSTLFLAGYGTTRTEGDFKFAKIVDNGSNNFWSLSWRNLYVGTSSVTDPLS